MAAPITWRNINAPNDAAMLRNISNNNATMANSIKDFGDVLTGFSDRKQGEANDAFAATVGAFQDPTKLAEARMGLMQGLDGKNIDRAKALEALNQQSEFLGSREKDRMSREKLGLELGAFEENNAAGLRRTDAATDSSQASAAESRQRLKRAIYEDSPEYAAAQETALKAERAHDLKVKRAGKADSGGGGSSVLSESSTLGDYIWGVEGRQENVQKAKTLRAKYGFLGNSLLNQAEGMHATDEGEIADMDAFEKTLERLRNLDEASGNERNALFQ